MIAATRLTISAADRAGVVGRQCAAVAVGAAVGGDAA